MPEDGVRVMVQVLMAVVVAGRLVLGRTMPMFLLLLMVWLLVLLSGTPVAGSIAVDTCAAGLLRLVHNHRSITSAN